MPEYQITIAHPHSVMDIIEIHDLIIDFYETELSVTPVNVISTITVPDEKLCAN